MNNIRKRLIGEHKKDCDAMRLFTAGQWKTPWYATGEIYWRDARGGKRGGNTQWLEFACNCDNCAARLIICADDILAASDEGIL